MSPSALPPPSEKARSVQRMFDRIAPDYDRINRLLTAGADQRWRRALVQRVAVGPRDTVLDLACGTGDFAEMVRPTGARVIGLDFSGVMLRQAIERIPGVPLIQADALRLPLADASLTVVLTGFALRNFESLPPVFTELARVLAPGGRLGILEVDQPSGRIVREGHAFYFNRVVPLVGGLLSDRQAYRYLPESAVYLPLKDELFRLLGDAGFHRIRKRTHMFGAAQAVTAVRR